MRFPRHANQFSEAAGYARLKIDFPGPFGYHGAHGAQHFGKNPQHLITVSHPANPNDSFGARLTAGDLSLFDAVPSQSSKGDRLSWLAVQSAVRTRGEGYVYLEIGSHLGGSIQQHLADPRCLKIFSIDKRPLVQPDDNRGACYYEGNSTERMMQNLRTIEPDADARVTTFDADTRELARDVIPEAPDLCFIDGEHTMQAICADFDFCMAVAKPDATFCFHDDFIAYPMLRTITRQLREQSIPFAARKLDGMTFAITLRGGPGLQDPAVLALGEDGLGFLERKHRHDLLVGWIPVKIRSALGSLLKK